MKKFAISVIHFVAFPVTYMAHLLHKLFPNLQFHVSRRTCHILGGLLLTWVAIYASHQIEAHSETVKYAFESASCLLHALGAAPFLRVVLDVLKVEA